MLKQKSLLFIGFCVVATNSWVKTTWYDNRFISFFDRNNAWLYDEPSSFSVECFASTAKEAWSRNDRKVGIPELYGTLDLKTLGDALVTTGQENPIPTAWQGVSIPYRMRGKIQTQGMQFSWHQALTDHCALGASWMFMNVQSCQKFFLKTRETDITENFTNLELGNGDIPQIDTLRRDMFTTIGLSDNHAQQLGFGDIELYFQVGTRWDYELKCRAVRAGLRFGALAPTGKHHEENRPASIPFGGDGHWGLYFSAHGMLEVKEDAKVGLLCYVSKRFEHCSLHRVPVSGEPQIFGALVAPISLNPGATVAVSPYFMMENVREGLAFGLAYTLTKHQKDSWYDAREDQTIPLLLEPVEKNSEWGSSYFTLHAAYDFGKTKVNRSFDPIISLRWDVPSELFVTQNVVKTHKLSLGIDFVF